MNEARKKKIIRASIFLFEGVKIGWINFELIEFIEFIEFIKVIKSTNKKIKKKIENWN